MMTMTLDHATENDHHARAHAKAHACDDDAVRRHILYHTQGLVAADAFVDNDGMCRELEGLDQAEAKDASAAATIMNDLALAETQVREDLPCMLAPPAKRVLKMCMAAAFSLEDFRAKLLAASTSGLDVRGIHFFRWNGEPRRHLHEVWWAMSHYATTQTHMEKTLQLLRAVSVLSDLGVKLPATMHDLVAQSQLLNEVECKGLGWSPALPKYMELFKLQVFAKVAYCGKPSANNVYCLYVRPFLATHADRLLQEL